MNVKRLIEEKFGKPILESTQKLLCAVVVVASLSACAHAPVNPGDTLVDKPLPPDSFGSALSLTQSASIETVGSQFELLFLTDIKKDRLVVAGLLPNGTRIFTLGYDGQNLSVEGDLELNEEAEKGIAPEYLLADFQLALWSQEVLQAHLVANNPCFARAQCVLRQQADGLTRELLVNGSTVVTITYSQVPHYAGTITIEHHQRMYVIVITPLEFSTSNE